MCALTSEGIIKKDVLIEVYKAVGDEARKVMLDTEARLRREVDEKADTGLSEDICASMYGHQMAGYMAEFVPTRPDSIVNQILVKRLEERGLTLDQTKEAFDKYQTDHEVQLTLQTMYQNKLDEMPVNPEFTIDKYCALTEDLKTECVKWVEQLHKNLDEKADGYMTGNMKMQMEQARMAVPSIAIFSSQYTVLRKHETTHIEKLTGDLLYSVWPQAQQANAAMHQALNDAHLKCYTPDQETLQQMQDMQKQQEQQQ